MPNRQDVTRHERGSESGLDYMLARYYSSSLGRFLAVDPGDDTALEDPQSWNKYAYVGNNPLGRIDPTGMYGQGSGWTDKQWQKFNKSQQKAAGKMEKKAAKLEEKAAKAEAKGDAYKAAAARTAAGNLSAGAAALRSDGSDGKIANAVNSATYQSLGGDRNGAAKADGPVVTVNIDHPDWEATGGAGARRAQWAVGHESLHTAGLEDLAAPGPDGATAYKYGNAAQREAFRELNGTPMAVFNPDHLMDMVY